MTERCRSLITTWGLATQQHSAVAVNTDSEEAWRLSEPALALDAQCLRSASRARRGPELGQKPGKWDQNLVANSALAAPLHSVHNAVTQRSRRGHSSEMLAS
jgi:hypothetical protein